MKIPLRNIVVILSVVGSIFVLSGCRAEHGASMSEPLDSVSESPWFNMDGEGELCTSTPDLCTGFDSEQEFVELCVAKGGKAKPCGCSMRCDVKVEYERQKPKPGVATKSEVSTDPATVCSDDEKRILGKIIDNRRPGGDQDRCIEDYFCQGTLQRCQEPDVAGVEKIRALARSGCSGEAFSALCRNGFTDSLQCPASTIKQLSTVYTALSEKSNPARRCTRNVLCFESEAGCDGSQKIQAQKYRALLNKDGCEYWLRNLCSLD